MSEGKMNEQMNEGNDFASNTVDTISSDKIDKTNAKTDEQDDKRSELWIVLGIGVFLLLVFSIGFLVYHSQNTSPLKDESPKDNDGWIPLTPEADKSETESALIPLNPEISGKESNLPPKTEKEEIVIKDADEEKKPFTEENRDFAQKEAQKKSPYIDENVDKETVKSKKKDSLYPPSGKISDNKTLDTGSENKGGGNEKSEVKKPLDDRNPSMTRKSTKVAPKPKVQNQTMQKIDGNKTPKVLKQYWIQVASLTAKKSADEARMELEKNKMPVNVFTYKGKNDEIYYRIRVGPYSSKEEAEYWKGKISCISLFKNEKCYVTSVE